VTVGGTGAPNPFAGLFAVSCTGTRSCVAGGTYNDTSEFGQAMIATDSHGTWARARELQMPSDAFTNPNGSVDSLACTGPGSCVAVGSYEPSPPASEEGFVATESAGTWGLAIKPRLPLNTAVSG